MFAIKLKETSCMQWAKESQILFIGSVKGDVLLYNRLTKTKTNLVLKHKKRVICAAWGKENKFCFCTEDRQV